MWKHRLRCYRRQGRSLFLYRHLSSRRSRGCYLETCDVTWQPFAVLVPSAAAMSIGGRTELQSSSAAFTLRSVGLCFSLILGLPLLLTSWPALLPLLELLLPRLLS